MKIYVYSKNYRNKFVLFGKFNVDYIKDGYVVFDNEDRAIKMSCLNNGKRMFSYSFLKNIEGR